MDGETVANALIMWMRDQSKGVEWFCGMRAARPSKHHSTSGSLAISLRPFSHVDLETFDSQ